LDKVLPAISLNIPVSEDISKGRVIYGRCSIDFFTLISFFIEGILKYNSIGINITDV
jgi:hypothetical protein